MPPTRGRGGRPDRLIDQVSHLERGAPALLVTRAGEPVSVHDGHRPWRFALGSLCRPEREERLTPLERERDAFEFDAGTAAAGGAESDIVAEDFDPFERPVGRDGGVEAEAVFEDPGDGRRVDRKVIVANLPRKIDRVRVNLYSPVHSEARTYEIGTAADDFATRPRNDVSRAFRVCVRILPVSTNR